MSPEAQRIAIAEACGWKFQGAPPYSPNESIIPPKGAIVAYKDLPDYLNDLNALHEAEKALDDELSAQWMESLSSAVHGNPDHVTVNMMMATAAQRAEAFLKTLNLWDYTK